MPRCGSRPAGGRRGERRVRGALRRRFARTCAPAPTIALLLACSVASPATEVREALAHAAPLEAAAGSARVAVERAVFTDIAVSTDRGRALVVAIVDADGRIRAAGREVAFGYLGREAFTMERCPARRWCAAGSPLPALAGVAEALLAAPRPDGRRPVRWQIRVERDRALVGEDGEAADGGRAPRAMLEAIRDGARWRITSER